MLQSASALCNTHPRHPRGASPQRTHPQSSRSTSSLQPWGRPVSSQPVSLQGKEPGAAARAEGVKGLGSTRGSSGPQSGGAQVG